MSYKCDDCETTLIEDDVNFLDDIPYCEECYREKVEECSICEEIFPQTECDAEGEYHFVFFESEKNPDMDPGIYRVNEFPFWWAVMFSEAKIIESAVTWVAPIPDKDCNSGKICKKCIEKYCKGFV